MNTGNVSRTANSSVAEEVLSDLVGREQLRDLIHRLNWLSDDNRLDDLLEQFTDDLRYEVEGMAVFHDKPSLRKFYEDVVGTFGMRIHRTSNELVEISGERATAQSYWRADLERQGRALVSAGRYFDEFVQVGGVWRVTSRKATLSYISPLDEGWARTRFFSLA
jgi:hypothetical protein